MESSIIAFVLIFFRTATFWFTVPLFGQVQPPRTVKLGLAFALSIFWYSSMSEIPAGVSEACAADLNTFHLIYLAVTEVVIGGTLGLSFHLFFVPLRVAGSYLSQELGLNLAALSDPSSPATATIVSTLTHLIAILLFYLLNLHHLIIYMLHSVFQVLPVASNSLRLETSGVLVEGFASVVGEGFGIVGGAAIALMILLVAIMMLAKAVPTFNLFSVGISLRLAAGLAIILIFLPDILAKSNLSFEHAQNYVESVVLSLTDG